MPLAGVRMLWHHHHHQLGCTHAGWIHEVFQPCTTTEHWAWPPPPKQRELLGQRVTISSPKNIKRKHELCFSSHLVFCSLQLWWWGDLQVGGATRLLQPWLSASCPPAAALQSSAGPSTKGAWPAPRARRRSVPPSSPACIAPGSRRRPTMAIITRPQMPTSRTTTKSTAKRRTSSRRRRKEVGLRLSACLWIFAHLTCRDEWTLTLARRLNPVHTRIARSLDKPDSFVYIQRKQRWNKSSCVKKKKLLVSYKMHVFKVFLHFLTL